MTPSSEVQQNVEERLAEIRARLASAAPGPWNWSRNYEIADDKGLLAKHWCLENPETAAKGQCIDGFLVLETAMRVDYGLRPLDETPNFALIAHAPSDIEALLSLASEREEEIARLRRLVWLRHPCLDDGQSFGALYGDDGEMQCAKCRFDFRRASAADIELHIIALNTAALNTAQSSVSSPKESTLQALKQESGEKDNG